MGYEKKRKNQKTEKSCPDDVMCNVVMEHDPPNLEVFS